MPDTVEIKLFRGPKSGDIIDLSIDFVLGREPLRVHVEKEYVIPPVGGLPDDAPIREVIYTPREFVWNPDEANKPTYALAYVFDEVPEADLHRLATEVFVAGEPVFGAVRI